MPNTARRTLFAGLLVIALTFLPVASASAAPLFEHQIGASVESSQEGLFARVISWFSALWIGAEAESAPVTEPTSSDSASGPDSGGDGEWGPQIDVNG